MKTISAEDFGRVLEASADEFGETVGTWSSFVPAVLQMLQEQPEVDITQAMAAKMMDVAQEPGEVYKQQEIADYAYDVYRHINAGLVAGKPLVSLDKIAIDDIFLEPMVVNALNRGGIWTVAQLKSMGAEKVRKLNSIGERKYQDIEEQLWRIGVRLE